jgi:hypothetical protein
MFLRWKLKRLCPWFSTCVRLWTQRYISIFRGDQTSVLSPRSPYIKERKTNIKYIVIVTPPQNIYVCLSESCSDTESIERKRNAELIWTLCVFYNFITQWVQTEKNRLTTCFHDSYLLGLFDPEDGGDMFLRNVSWFSPGYKALYPRR